MVEQRECERCGERPDSWFFNGGYVCSVCMDEWTVLSWIIDAWWSRG